jgi:hypothetical protein
MKYRCWHCKEVFADDVSARAHFGPTVYSSPACQMGDAELRELEAQLASYRAEDTNLHREMHAAAGEAQVRILRAEEEGYERGLRVSVAAVQACVEVFDIMKDVQTLGSIDCDRVRYILDRALKGPKVQMAKLSVPHDGCGYIEQAPPSLVKTGMEGRVDCGDCPFTIGCAWGCCARRHEGLQP